MPTGFMKCHETRIGANPQRAVDLVTGPDVKGSLAEAWSVDAYSQMVVAPAYPNFCDRVGQFQPVALLMNGTTSELDTALRNAVAAGTKAFWASGDTLLGWYLRRKAGMETKTLILIAPKYRFLDVQEDDPTQCYADQGQGQGWRFLCNSQHDDGVGYGGLSLDWFIQNALPRAKGQDAWW